MRVFGLRRGRDRRQTYESRDRDKKTGERGRKEYEVSSFPDSFFYTLSEVTEIDEDLTIW